jgi:hypothetical protein
MTRTATQTYRANQDSITRFLEHEAEHDAQATTPTPIL